VSDDDDRKKRLANLIRNNVRPKDTGAPGIAPISVNGHHNVISLHGAKIVIRGPDEPPKVRNGKPKQKKTTWHTELEGLIWQRVWDLGMTSEQFYELAEKKLRRPAISSLAKIAERDLGVLYEMMASMRRPALD
jgi:hypothetical protein